MIAPFAFAERFRDLQKFAQVVELKYPHWAWLLLVVPVCAFALQRYARHRSRRRALTALHPNFTAQLVRPKGRAGRVGLGSLGILLLLVGLLGPHWGRGENDGVASGRDVVLVLDLSRSMIAEDTQGPSRAAAAIRTATDLVDALRLRGGGHRVGIVAFAARAKVLVPLTTDTDHVRLSLAELDPAFPPPDIRATDQSRSGTRIGAGLFAALAVCDERFPQSQSIVLLSDGDDPLDDGERLAAVGPARLRRIPIHAIGFGDPERDSTIASAGKLLEFTDENGIADPVQTRLREALLKQLALETRGLYLPARRETPTVEPFLTELFAAGDLRELTDDPVPRSRDRSGLFFGLAGLFLVAAAVRRR